MAPDEEHEIDVQNKTQRPLTIPLPGGKKLRLGPGRVGQITPKAAQHPPVKERIDAGELQVLDPGKSKGSGAATTGTGPSQRDAPTRGIRHTGDR